MKLLCFYIGVMVAHPYAALRLGKMRRACEQMRLRDASLSYAAPNFDTQSRFPVETSTGKPELVRAIDRDRITRADRAALNARIGPLIIKSSKPINSGKTINSYEVIN